MHCGRTDMLIDQHIKLMVYTKVINEKRFTLLMDVFKVLAELILPVSIAVAVPCGKKKKKKGSKSIARSVSSSTSRSAERTPAVEKAPDINVKLLPEQLRQIVEAEQMAKASQGYESYDIQLDDDKK